MGNNVDKTRAGRSRKYGETTAKNNVSNKGNVKDDNKVVSNDSINKSVEDSISSWTSSEGREKNKDIKEKAKDALSPAKKSINSGASGKAFKIDVKPTFVKEREMAAEHPLFSKSDDFDEYSLNFTQGLSKNGVIDYSKLSSGDKKVVSRGIEISKIISDRFSQIDKKISGFDLKTLSIDDLSLKIQDVLRGAQNGNYIDKIAAGYEREKLDELLEKKKFDAYGKKAILGSYKRDVYEMDASTRPEMPEFGSDAHFESIKNEYDNNPSLPKFGTREHYIEIARTMAPSIEKITQDVVWRDGTQARQLAEEYLKNPNFTADADTLKSAKYFASKLSMYRNELKRYADVLRAVSAYGNSGVHFKADGSVDVEGGKEEASLERKLWEPLAQAMFYDAGHLRIFSEAGILVPEADGRYKLYGESSGAYNLAGHTIDAYDYYDRFKNSKYKNNLFGVVAGNYRLGDAGERQAKVGADMYYSKSTDTEAAELYDLTMGAITDGNEKTFNNSGSWWKSTVSTISSYAPQGLNQAKVNLVGRAIGYIMSGGNAKVSSVVAEAMTAKYMFDNTAGMSYYRHIKNGLSKDDAYRLASSEAISSAVVEFGVGLLADGIIGSISKKLVNPSAVIKKLAKEGSTKGAAKVISTLAKEGFSKEGIKVVLGAGKNIVKGAGGLVINNLSEGVEEWIQQGMSVVADRYAAEGKSLSAAELFRETFAFSKYTKEDYESMNESFVSGFVIGTFGQASRSLFNRVTGQGGNAALTALSSVNEKALGKEVLKLSNSLEIVNESVNRYVLSSDKEMAKVALSVRAKIQSGEELSPKDVGKLVKGAVLSGDNVLYNAGESRDVNISDGEDIVFSVKDEKSLKNSVRNDKIKENGDVEFDSDFDAIFDEAISRAKITKVKMSVFPPYNKSKSDANERATRWAFNEDVQTGAQAIAFYHDQSYIIEKFDSTEFKYIIKGLIDYGDYQNIRKELKFNAQTGNEKSIEKLASVYDKRNRQRDTSKRRGQSIDGNSIKYRDENNNVQRVGEVENSEWEIYGNTDRSDERNGSYRQSGSLEKDIESSDNEDVLLSVGGSLKISENKKTAPTIRESHLESQDRLSPIGTVSNNSISQNDEKNNKNITKLYGRLGYSVISEPNPEVKLPEGAVVDGYVDHKRGEVYISPNAENGVYKHELMHIISRMSKRNSQSFLEFCKKNVSEWDELYKENEKKYNDIKSKNPDFAVSENLLEQETIADLSIELSKDEVIEKYRDSGAGFLGRVSLWFKILKNQAAVYFGKDSSQERKLKIASMKWELALASAKKREGGGGISFMYAGEKSKTADRSMLNRAKEMSINGDEPSVIWKETGWRLGADGKWHFEIDDSKAVLKSIPSEAKSLKLGDILVHDELYKAYPQLRNVKVEFRDDMRRIDKGNYNSGDNVIKLNLKNNEVEMKDAVIHEVQHAVQNIEGYEAGGNVQSALMRLRRNTITKLLSESPYFRKVCKERSPADVVEYVDNYLKKKYNKENIEDVAYMAYRDLYGEREARDTSARQDMSAEQRLDDFSEYEKGALLGNEYSEYEIQANTILQKVYPFDMVHEVSSLEDGTGHSEKLEAGDILRREVASGETSEIGNRQSVEVVESDEYESPKRRVKSADEILDEIDIVDELLRDPDIDAEERAELRVKKKKLERSYADKRRSLSGELKSLDERTAKKNENKEESVPPFKYEEAVKTYKETGDSSGIPDKKSARMTQKYYAERADEALLALGDVEGDLAAGRYESEAERLEMETRRDALKTQLREAVSKNEVMKQVLDILDEIDTAARPNHTWLRDVAINLSDKQNIIKDGLYKTNDVERNFRNFFGKYFKTAYEKVLKPFYDSKKNYAEGVEEYAKRLREEIVDSLKIKAGSRESAAVMWLGEGRKPINKKAGADLADYTYEDCVKEFGEKRASDIKKASEIFRKMYDELLDKVNETRAKIYPNNPDKLVEKRKDYFHHFQEMGQGFSGLRNILNTNIGIDPMLVGTSEHTKPKSKWQGFAQRRLGERTEYDAVLGFLKYLPAAQYSIHIDPNIVNFRSLAYDLASAKAAENKGMGNPNANVFIEYLQKFANSLAGKTVSNADRGWISYAGRTSLAVMSWLNNMTKASAVLGNVNSVLSQVTNVKNMIGKISHQSDALRGALETLTGINPKSAIASRYNESGFLKERFLQDSLDDYKMSAWNFKKVMQTPGHFAAWILGFADEVGTRITWNAAYNEAIRKNIKDASQYADNFTRSCVAGRGIGEDALVFKSQMAKLFLPFRTEVLNDLRVQQDILFGKEYDIWEKNEENKTDAFDEVVSKKKTYGNITSKSEVLPKGDTFDEIIAMGKDNAKDISPRKLTRVKNIMQLFVASAVINAVIAAIKSDEFDPLDEAEEGFEESGVFGALESILKDYADGIGDPVAFDPIYDIATGVYQGIAEGEDIGGKVGKAALRVGQNLLGDAVSNNPFSTVAMSALGVDSEVSDFLFNGNVYTPGGAGMPLAGNVTRSLAEVVDKDYLSAVVAIAKGFVPMGTQIDRSVKGLYEYGKGYATSEAAYERMTGQDGDLKYLIEPGFWNGFRSLLFGSGAFSKESDAFYNEKSRKFNDEEQAEVLSHKDYESRKVTFDDILAMNKYESKEEKDKRKEERAKEFFDAHPDGILHNLYLSGEESAIPYKNVAGETSFTDSKTKKKYTLKLKAEEAERLTKEVSDKIAQRFVRAESSESFEALSREEQVKYLDAVADSEYKQAKVKALYDSGQMGYEDYYRLEANYKETEAKRDRFLYVDDASVQVEFNAADVVGQYITYSDVPISEEGIEQLNQWYEYSSNRKPDDVDSELMRLSSATGSDINVSGNVYGVISYEKNGVNYKIAMPDNKIYALCDEVDKAVRSALYSLISKQTYKNAQASEQKKMVDSVKRKVRDGIKDKYKARYKSVRVTEFDKIIAMK